MGADSGQASLTFDERPPASPTTTIGTNPIYDELRETYRVVAAETRRPGDTAPQATDPPHEWRRPPRRECATGSRRSPRRSPWQPRTVRCRRIGPAGGTGWPAIGRHRRVGPSRGRRYRSRLLSNSRNPGMKLTSPDRQHAMAGGSSRRARPAPVRRLGVPDRQSGRPRLHHRERPGPLARGAHPGRQLPRDADRVLGQLRALADDDASARSASPNSAAGTASATTRRSSSTPARP